MDIVSDVMAAAHPVKLSRAEDKLRQTARAPEQSRGLFGKIAHSLISRRDVISNKVSSPTTDIVADVMANANPKRSQLAALKLDSLGNGGAGTDNSARREAMTKLESVLLTNALDSMLPKSNGSLYGDETSGNIWRGLQIEKMSDALAKRGMLNLAADFPDQDATGGATGSAGTADFEILYSTRKITSFAPSQSTPGES